MIDFFTEAVAESYDEKNSRLAPIADNMHFLVRLVLQDLPACSRVLCVGVGTGAEILSLAGVYPELSFVGVDPSAAMLAVCQERLKRAGVLERCELIHGCVQDLPAEECFDAVISILVAHFVKREERPDFYRSMMQRLRVGGYLVNTELSFDLNAAEFRSMLKNWERVQTLMGATPDSLKSLPDLLRNTLTVLPPTEVERLVRGDNSGTPVQFFQALMIRGWYLRKD